MAKVQRGGDFPRWGRIGLDPAKTEGNPTPAPMKMPPTYVRILVQLFCLLGIMSCQTRKPETVPSPAANLGRPDPVSGSDMKSMEEAKENFRRTPQ